MQAARQTGLRIGFIVQSFGGETAINGFASRKICWGVFAHAPNS